MSSVTRVDATTQTAKKQEEEPIKCAEKTWKFAALVFGYVTAAALTVYLVARFCICAPFLDSATRDFTREMSAIRTDLDQKQQAWQN